MTIVYTAEKYPLYRYFDARKKGEPANTSQLTELVKQHPHEISSWIFCDAAGLGNIHEIIVLCNSEIPRSSFAVAIAADAGHVYIVKFLIEQGFEINPYGLIYAVQRRFDSIVEILLNSMSVSQIRTAFFEFKNYAIPEKYAAMIRAVISEEVCR